MTPPTNHHPSDQSTRGLSPTRRNVEAAACPRVVDCPRVADCPRREDPRHDDPHRGGPRCGDPRCSNLCSHLANGNKSEVARLREQIEAEYEAAHQALYGLAQGTARHDIIQAHMANAQQYGQQLIDRIGKDEALPIIVQAIDEAVQEKQ
jgi:hypothetical protein